MVRDQGNNRPRPPSLVKIIICWHTVGTKGGSRVIIGLCAKIMQFCSNHDTNVEHVQWKPIKCHCTTWMPLRPIHCHSPQIWVNFTNWQPLCHLFATLPLECHWVFFQCHSALWQSSLCKHWACEARGQTRSETGVTVGLDPLTLIKTKILLMAWHRGGV